MDIGGWYGLVRIQGEEVNGRKIFSPIRWKQSTPFYGPCDHNLDQFHQEHFPAMSHALSIPGKLVVNAPGVQDAVSPGCKLFR